MNRNAPPGFLGRWSRRKRDARLGQPVETQPTSPAAPEVPEVPDRVAAVAPVAPGPSPASPADPEAPAGGTDQGHPPQPVALAAEAEGANAVPGRTVEPTVKPAVEAPALTLDDVRGLTFESDYTRFTDRAVPADVRNAAMKKLFFSDPHFNTMDGLDVYIEDYNVYQPLTESMLRKMVSARAVGMFADEPPLETQAFPVEGAEPAPGATPAPVTPEPTTPEPATPDLVTQNDDDMRAADRSRDSADTASADTASADPSPGEPSSADAAAPRTATDDPLVG